MLLLPVPTAASTQDRVRICRSVSQECRQLVDSQVHKLRANLKSLSTHNDSLSLPLRFPRLESLSFDRAGASESSRLLQCLATQQPQLLAHLQELDLSLCQVCVVWWVWGVSVEGGYNTFVLRVAVLLGSRCLVCERSHYCHRHVLQSWGPAQLSAACCMCACVIL